VVIPLRDDNPVRRVPVVTYLLIALNVAVFLTEPIAFGRVGGDVTQVTQVCRQERFFERWGAIPHELLRNQQQPTTVVAASPERHACVVGPSNYRKTPLLSALTAMFLHGGWLHLLGNMLFLYVFGNNVEDRFGRLRFLLWYLGWGVVATYGFALLNPASTTAVVGASGAIAGVLGAYFVLFPRVRVLSLVPIVFFIPMRLPAWLVLGSWFVLQWLYASGAGVTTGSGVAYAAHVAGFVAGVLVGRRHRVRGPSWA
jgi:membrane associated rhomboid family serine protease